MGVSDLRIVSDVPAGSHLVELTLEDLAKHLGLEEVDVPLLMRTLEDAAKNLTVGDVHATTSLKDVTVAYIQGEDDGEEDEEDEAKKAEQERDDHGRFAGEHNAASQAHLAALTAAGTDRPKFEAAHAALSSDKGVTNAGLRAIAGGYGSGHVHPAGASRQRMLDELKTHFTHRARFESKTKRDDGEVVFDLTVTKSDPEQRKIFGWASVCAFDGKLVVDKQDDIIHVADLERAAHDFTLYSRTQGDMHQDIGVGRLIESVIFDQAKRDAGIIAKDDKGRVIDGWWVGFYVDDDGVWESHKRGERPEFSIGGRARREEFVDKSWSDAARAAAADARARASAARALAQQRPGQAGHYAGAAESYSEAASHFEQSVTQTGKERSQSRSQAEEHMRAGNSRQSAGHRSHATGGRSAG